MRNIAIVFPNQLFQNVPFQDCRIFLIEEYLFFKQYRFHKQKIAFHRASMKFYFDFLVKQGHDVRYIDSQSEDSDIRVFLKKQVKIKSLQSVRAYDPVDDWLRRRISGAVPEAMLTWETNPLFLNTRAELSEYFDRDLKSYHMADFYKLQRKKTGILMAGDRPVGGKWSFDEENRKRFPAKRNSPPVAFPDAGQYYKEAVAYTKRLFGENYGQIDDNPRYPVTFSEAKKWLDDFLEHRFHGFGDYEDSIVGAEHILHHSVLSPLLNVGLLDLRETLDTAVAFAEKEKVPLNAVEGFVRQLIGWREFVRGVYEKVGTEQRLSNKLRHTRNIPASFYDGTTGIPPIDQTIKKVVRTAYAHHIERLMVLSSFMNLCGFDPDQVYQCFMELFIDAYDWVMVPNVYGMSLFADGGRMSTKPYISGSNYIRKMSDYKRGEWEEIWDALYWNFVDANKKMLAANPRTTLVIANWERMEKSRKQHLLETAREFLSRLR